MTSVTDIVNQALQTIGTRTSVTDAELATNSTNEAIQANILIGTLRDGLLRMAQWDFAFKTANITLISSVPGTPENTSPATALWQPGQPAPPWSYEYQYPIDCLRAIGIIPANQTGFADGVPITTAVTGGAAAWWQGPPVKFKIQTDTFVPVTAAAVVNGGAGHQVGDVITMPTGDTTQPPIGAPVQLLITGVGVGNAITSVSVVNVVLGAPVSAPLGGSYFAAQPNPIAQGTTTGVGVGATFNLTYGPPSNQRVVLTNQEFATLQYIKQITDPNMMDSLFQTAWIKLLGAGLQMALRGDKALANQLIEQVNDTIKLARAADANEGLTQNDVTPDWLRIRGVAYAEGYVSGPYTGYDWGGVWPFYN